MSHFTVLVLANDPEDQLEPFSEHIKVDPVEEGLISEMDIMSFREHYQTFKEENKELTKDDVKANKKLTFEQLYDKYGEEWNDGRWKLNEDGEWAEYSTYNPDSKWDWYQLGGRWCDFLKLKKGAEGGLFGRSSDKHGWCDQALKKNIDFEGMRDEAGEEGRKHYTKILELFGGTIPKLEITWAELFDETNEKYNKLPNDEKREIFRNQPAMLEVKKHHEELGWGFELEPYQKPIEDYVKVCRDNAIGTYAVLVNGEWHEKGQMGWFGMSSNEKDDWDEEFQKLLDSVDDDTLISLYDCHI